MSVIIKGRKATMEEEQQLAVEMWEFVRLCQLNFHMDESSASLKRDFCKIKLKCGIDIEWSDDCFLCSYSCSCLDCPLYKLGGNITCAHCESPYGITMKPDIYKYYQIDEAIDKIIEAIESF